MSMSLHAMSDELRIIRVARRNGRKLGIHPCLLRNPVTDAREQYLSSVLSPSTEAAA